MTKTKTHNPPGRTQTQPVVVNGSQTQQGPASGAVAQGGGSGGHRTTPVAQQPQTAATERCMSLIEYEMQFLSYQRDLREGATHVLNEAMRVLDIIDVKTQSLLSYIAVSLAAMIFLITSLPSSSSIKPVLMGPQLFTSLLLVLIVALLGASVLCLTCLNIVGAHTIRSMASRQKQSQEEYERFIVKVTLGRRNRYLVAHHVSVATAVLTFVLFVLILANVIRTAPGKIGDSPATHPAQSAVSIDGGAHAQGH